MNRDIEVIQARIRETSGFVDRLLDEVGRVIVGQKTMVERLLIGLLSDGHVLMEGVPGLAKTLTIRTLADAIRTSFQRIQFTPDLLPADLIGTLIYDPRKTEFETRKGPIFANVILADEINRSPAKVQSALLEAMQERTVTIGENTFPLPSPFLVLATQNPIEQEGTYPLPEAQVDRFMLKLSVGYPDREEELEIMRRMSAGPEPKAEPVVTPDEILTAREAVETIYMDSKVERYIVDLVFATREPRESGLKELEPLIAFGGSPRATICLARTARAHAFLRHRGYVTPEDVRSVAMDVLRHRVILTYEAEAEEMTTEDVVTRVLDTIEVP
ncbi:MAG: AAA domain-containing protein [Gemmatimonadetes bacterium]|nr:AAA domain-containing protein [Gemmatimonadota bacterium]MYA64288.1 AAA domain-containing protein [Gemmatimonadota bacterium]MYB99877.1 AAA domain-containing protein [Gemmatimonadota bacterium]MYH53596.1 AAA domain-containing protein [Gemmatimonadota bacterium]MYI45654.1 AAA domain-containing protein [Gemmatimonadota bacterium]